MSVWRWERFNIERDVKNMTREKEKRGKKQASIKLSIFV